MAAQDPRVRLAQGLLTDEGISKASAVARSRADISDVLGQPLPWFFADSHRDLVQSELRRLGQQADAAPPRGLRLVQQIREALDDGGDRQAKARVSCAGTNHERLFDSAALRRSTDDEGYTIPRPCHAAAMAQSSTDEATHHQVGKQNTATPPSVHPFCLAVATAGTGAAAPGEDVCGDALRRGAAQFAQRVLSRAALYATCAVMGAAPADSAASADDGEKARPRLNRVHATASASEFRTDRLQRALQLKAHAARGAVDKLTLVACATVVGQGSTLEERAAAAQQLKRRTGVASDDFGDTATLVCDAVRLTSLLSASRSAADATGAKTQSGALPSDGGRRPKRVRDKVALGPAHVGAAIDTERVGQLKACRPE